VRSVKQKPPRQLGALVVRWTLIPRHSGAACKRSAQAGPGRNPCSSGLAPSCEAAQQLAQSCVGRELVHAWSCTYRWREPAERCRGPGLVPRAPCRVLAAPGWRRYAAGRATERLADPILL